jgi:DNA-binding response OmpR family regulator
MMTKTIPARLLVVDQDTRYGEWLKHHLGVLCPESPVSVLRLTDFERWSEELSGRDCDVLMLAASFGTSPEDPQAQGLELLRQLREKPHFPAVIAVAEEGNELTAVRALQLGAVDYLPKRLLTPERLKTSVKLALRMIEKRVARRIASLAFSSDAQSTSVVLPAKLAVATDAADAADAKAAEALRPPLKVTTGASGANTTTAAAGNPAQASTQTESSGSADATANSTDAKLEPETSSVADRTDRAAAGSAVDTQYPGAADGVADTRNRRMADSVADMRNRRMADSAADTRNRRMADSIADTRNRGMADSAADTRDGAAAGSATDTPGRAAAASSADTQDRAAAAGEVAPGKLRSNAKAKATAEASRTGEGNSAADAPPAKQSGDSSAPFPAAKVPGGEFMPANFIPGYTIHATIGESEKAAVYVATSAALNENVALKVSKTLRDEAAGRQFLEREYRAIVAIRDPSVVQIYDYGVHAGYEYLVMEYLPRGDLKARMQQPLTELEALRYVAQIAAALQVVHQAGLLHRDLKPPNVMLRENGDVALIDFGLARALDGSSASTRTGVLRGSPYYMSPEQALGEVLDARSDFYSLGIMYYEMLTGKKPYTGGSAMDVLQQHVNAPLPMLPKALVQHEPLLLKLMAKSREDRFATAEDILVAIAARREVERAAERESAVESSAA